MKIELTARWTRMREDKRSPKQRKEEERLKRILSKDEDEYDSEEEFHKNAYFAYDPLTIDTHDIVGWNKFDEEHTTVRTEGANYIIRTPYDIFSSFYFFITGEGQAKKPEDFQFAVRMETIE